MPVTTRYGPPIYNPTNGAYLGLSWTESDSRPITDRRHKPEDLFASSTAMTWSRERSQNALYLAYKHPYDSKYDSWGILYDGQEATFSWTDDMYAVRMKLLDAVKRQNVNLAMVMAEYRETCSQFLNLSRTLYQGYRNLRRMNLRGFYSSKEFSKRWIEYQFGLAPVASDLQGLCDSLADNLREGIHIHKSVSNVGRQNYTRSFPDTSGNGRLTVEEIEYFSIRLDARWSVRDSTLHNVSRFGFSNPAALAYELVPFSFVVDWMFPVGGWLTHLDTLNGINLLYIQNTKTVRHRICSESNSGHAAIGRTETKGRSQVSDNLQITPFRYEPSESLKKVLTGLSLLRIIQKGT